MYRQLEIRWVDLEPTRGAETQKKRPCVIIQSDLVNRGSRTVIVAPLLPEHKPWPFAVNITPAKANGVDKDRHRFGDPNQSQTTPCCGYFQNS